ncbi:transposase [Verminephrobacter eiseniae]|uniref:transposase n=1 Tax=Verminephrobacter eiseniae TaxID=364317 RepID=UPI0012EE16BC|nr:transposase [Verminephrobacter eiseniae]MCW5284402.1 hypothetical protein [Verminephrobacter eiseniae]MCW5302108.1 hypothetical protein [Verminephrobacter eiseniae]
MLGVGCRLKVSASFTCRRFRRLSPRSRSANSSCAQLIRSIFSSKNQQLTAESSRCVQSDGLKADAVLADKGYDADALIDSIQVAGATAVIPPRRNRVVQRSYDRHLYKERNLVERFFNRIKQFRRIATRYEKLARNYLSFLSLVCTYIWIT